MKKIFAIGDIHGCLHKLTRLVEGLGVDPAADTLVFLGDYIDREDGGPDVVDYVLGLKAGYRNVLCLCGNHEYMFLRYLEGLDENLYLENGGRSTLQAYGISLVDSLRKRKSKVPPAHLKFFNSLLPYYETDDYIFVHAGLKPGVALSEQTLHDMVWIRADFIDSDFDFGKKVIFGHTHRHLPIIAANKIGIDTGAVYGGKLTCLELPAETLHQV